MAVFTRPMALKLQTTKDGDIEDIAFAAGDAVTVVHTWANFFLVKDAEGHFYNVPKACLAGADDASMTP